MAIRSPQQTTKQGIAVAILTSDAGGGAGGGRRGASLRRTLSADMSSRRWMEQSGLRGASPPPPIKRVASSKDFSLNCPVPDSGEDDEERVEIKKEFDIWSSIISQKASGDAAGASPPYIHPLVKRAKSSLSENSLQVCTESLGSETGSDGFSASSDASDSESECSQKEETDQTACRDKSPQEDHAWAKSGPSPVRKSFPPPLPSLSSRCGGDGTPTLRMRSHRVDGRLVVEAVSVPASQRNFAAQRQDGRLVLMFSGQSENPEEAEVEEPEEETVYETVPATTRKLVDFATEPRLISFHKLAVMADKRRNNREEGAGKKPGLVAASLPPRPRGPGGRLNQYEYFWRSKLQNDSKTVENDKKQRVVLEGQRVDGFSVSSFKGCFEKQRRPLTWEPKCIATS